MLNSILLKLQLTFINIFPVLSLVSEYNHLSKLFWVLLSMSYKLFLKTNVIKCNIERRGKMPYWALGY